MKCLKTKCLNQSVNENPEKLVLDSENNYTNQLRTIAASVNEKKDTHPVVLISGPSGSGKTSTAYEIARFLNKEYDCSSSVISLDNYFRSNNEPDMPRDKDGNIDLESPYCVDLELLKEHLRLLEAGEEFMMPEFDFKLQGRSGYTPFKREKGSIAILEGIHALNPLVTGDCGDFATCVYISVRTRLKTDSGKLLHPRIIRLMRRLCRDCLFRGRDIASVFSFFEKVSVGEDKFILPFKHRANFQVDTFMAYEVPVYKNCLIDQLENVRDEFVDNNYYKTIMEFFEAVLPLNKSYAPEISLVREFIG